MNGKFARIDLRSHFESNLGPGLISNFTIALIVAGLAGLVCAVALANETVATGEALKIAAMAWAG